MEEVRVGKYRIDMVQRREGATIYKIVDTDENRTLPGDYPFMTTAIMRALEMEDREKSC